MPAAKAGRANLRDAGTYITKLPEAEHEAPEEHGRTIPLPDVVQLQPAIRKGSQFR